MIRSTLAQRQFLYLALIVIAGAVGMGGARRRGVPATLVWRFSVGFTRVDLLLWITLTFGLGWLATEAERHRATPAPLHRQRCRERVP